MCAAAAPPTLTPIPQNKSPSSLILPTLTILYRNITRPHLRCCPDTLLGGGIDGPFPWSSQSFSALEDNLRVTHLSTQILGGGAGVVLGALSPEALGLEVDWEGGTGIVMAKRRVFTLG